MWVVQGEGSGDQSAHGEADDTGRGQLQMVEQFAQLIGIPEQPTVGVRTGTGTVAEHVIGNNPIVWREANDLAAPHFFVQPDPVDQDHGLAFAGRQVTGAGRGAFSGVPNHGALLPFLFDYWAFSAASSSRSI